MANVKLSFLGTEKSETDSQYLELFANTNNEIYIEIYNNDGDIFYHTQSICLDKSTAIKLAKTLRSEINKLEDVNNG